MGMSNNSRRYPAKSNSKPSVDPDADWMAIATKVDVIEAKTKTNRSLYIPAFPIQFLQDISACGDAIGLLLIAMTEMRMRGLAEIPIGQPLWVKVGSPPRRVKSRLLAQIGKAPTDVCTLIARPGRPHLLRVGPKWPTKMSR